MKGFIELIYSVIVGIAVVLFAGFSIWAFYPSPKAPEYPDFSNNAYSNNGGLKPDFQAKQDEYDHLTKKHDEEMKSYNVNISIIALVIAAVFYALGLVVRRFRGVLAEGLLFGGIFIAIYSLGYAVATEKRPMVFLCATFILVAVLALVSIKFQNTDKTHHPYHQ